MEPSIGRVVHYTSRGSLDGVFVPVCRAAVITEVHRDDQLDICVLNPDGLFFNHLVPFGYEPGSWHWPERIPE